MANFKTKKQQQADDFDLQNLWKEAIREKYTEMYTPEDGGIVDVITFCEKFLGLNLNNNPYLKLVLKMYYVNSLGNEGITISDEDVELIKDIDNYGKGNPWLLDKVEKLRNGTIKEPFQYLVLVLGRRSGKTFLASIIISYEVYKLLGLVVCPKCKDRKTVKSGTPCPDCGERCLNKPQAYYGLQGNEPLRIFLAAVAQKQAIDPGLAFVKIRVTESKFFDDKFAPEVENLFFQTEYDKELNERWHKAGLPEQEKGSVFVRALASNSSTSHGTGSVCLLLDEFALFGKDADAKESDKKIIEALVPQTMSYRFRGDGRVIMISMPEGEEGEFYAHYEKAKYDNEMLMFQMPTWEFRGNEPAYSKENCAKIWKSGAENEEGGFDKLYGAQFSNQGEEYYFSSDLVNAAFDTHMNLHRLAKPANPHNRHYMHVDCASTSDNYAYCIVHTEYRRNPQTGSVDLYYLEDDSYFWTPKGDNKLRFIGEKEEDVDIYGLLKVIVEKAKIFRVESISFDNMQSVESKTFFMKHGLRLRQLPFNGRAKANMYGNLRHMMSGQRVILCPDDIKLKEEMKGLKVYINKRGRQIEMSKLGGRKRTDDKIDCLVGACYMTSQNSVRKFPNINIVQSIPIFSNEKGNNSAGGGVSIFQRQDLRDAYNGSR